MPNRYPRDLHGYGATTPDPKWPGGANIAVQFVINYEEGSENCVLDGDAQSEHLLRLAREGVRLCGVDVLRSALLVAKYSMLRQRSKHVHAFSLALTCPHARAHTPFPLNCGNTLSASAMLNPKL